jgi:hypothetical protein
MNALRNAALRAKACALALQAASSGQRYVRLSRIDK